MATYKEVISEDGTISNFYRISGTDTIANDTQSTDVSYDYEDLNNKPTINGIPLVGDVTLEELGIKIPGSTGDLPNDAGFITKEVDDLINYYSKVEINKKLEEKQDKLIEGNNISIVNNTISTKGDRLPIYMINGNWDFQDDGQGSLVYYNGSELLAELSRVVQDAKNNFERFQLILNINHTPALFTVDMEATLPMSIKPGTLSFCGIVYKGNDLDSRKYGDYAIGEIQQSLYLALYLTWTEDMVSVRRASLRAVAPEGRFVGEDYVQHYYLGKQNTQPYAPTNNYNPATKKYVDDLVNSFYALTILSWDKNELEGDYDNSQHEIATAMINKAKSTGNVTYVLISVNNEIGSILAKPFAIHRESDVYYLEEAEDYRTVLLGEWVGGIYECTSMRREKYTPYLAKNNTDEYIPTDPYNPATKNYVDTILDDYYTKEETMGEVNGALEKIDLTPYQKKLVAGNNIVIEEDTNKISAIVNLENIPTNDDVLRKDNTSVFVPTGEFNPVTKKYVDDLFANIEIPEAGLRLEIVSELPTENIETNVIYLVLDIENSSEMNVYKEWVYLTSLQRWEQIGTTALDLSPYALNENVLTKNNITEYNPTTEYNPATKKYVDDLVNEKTGDIQDEIDGSGFITNAQEMDPIFTNSPAFDITDEDMTEWNRIKTHRVCTIDLTNMIYNLSTFKSGTLTDSTVLYRIQQAIEKFGGYVSLLICTKYITLLYQYNGFVTTSSGTKDFQYTTIIVEDGVPQAWASEMRVVQSQSTGQYLRIEFTSRLLVREQDVITKTNTNTYAPTADYHPSTKKYVDDSIGALKIPESLDGLDNSNTQYITNAQEQDPIFTDSPAYGITEDHIEDWNRINNIKICPISLAQEYDLYNNTVSSTDATALNVISQYAVEFGMQNVLMHVCMPNSNVLYYYGKSTTTDNEITYTFNTILYNGTNARPCVLNIKYNKTSATFTTMEFTPQGVMANRSEVLAKNNATEYTPTNDYNPSTKKYVDDSIKNLTLGEINNDAGFITSADLPDIPKHVLDISTEDIERWNKAEEDPHFMASEAAKITEAMITSWNTAAADTPFKGSDASRITADMINEWNAEETDPVFTKHVVSGITKEQIDAWDAKPDMEDVNGAIGSSVPEHLLTITPEKIAEWDAKADMDDLPTDLGDLDNKEKGYLTNTHPAAGITKADINRWNAKQDQLIFNTEYHPTANPVATMADVLAATPNVLAGEY